MNCNTTHYRANSSSVPGDPTFTQIAIGNPGPQPWWQRWQGSVAQRLIALAGDIAVHVAAAARPGSGRAPSAPREPITPGPYAIALGCVVLATAVGVALRHVLEVGNLSLVFLTAVLASAVVGGLGPSLLACLLSLLCYNFFFLPPLYTFTIADPENVVALFFFAVVAVIASNLTAAVRAQAVVARQRARTTEELYGFSRKLAGIGELDDLLWATSYQIATMLRLHVMLLLPSGDRLVPRVGYPPDDRLAEADLAAAEWCWRHDRPTGRGSDTLPGARWLFLPLRTGRGILGVIGLDRDAPGSLLNPDQQRLLDALADQAAVSVERILLAEDLDRTRIEAEADRLRAALLTSVSHDLRTPLASIRGAAETLEAYDATLAPPERRELLRSVVEESERMGRFVSNLLDMTRIEAGVVVSTREAVDIGEAAGSAVARAAGVLAGHKVVLDIAPGLKLPRLDPVLFEQVLFNLLDNAAKYAPAGSAVTLAARQEGAKLVLRVLDEGPGLPPDELERIFEPFHRAGRSDGRPAGTGLGLAICRGFLGAMGGRIVAGNRADRPGAVFTVTLPTPA